MKLTKETLKKIIKEELEAVMREGPIKGLSTLIKSLPVEKETQLMVVDLLQRIRNDDEEEDLYDDLKDIDSTEEMERFLGSWISYIERKISEGELTDYGAMYEDVTK